jgi:hypothetical protein
MVLSIIFLEDKHKFVLHLSILYEYQQFVQHGICFSIQPQLQLVNLHRNRRYFVIQLHTWFCLSYFLKTNIKCYSIYQYFMSICFSIQPPDYSDPWPRLANLISFFILRLFNSIGQLGLKYRAVCMIYYYNLLTWRVEKFGSYIYLLSFLKWKK